MKCPACPESNLFMSKRQGVEIDYCPHCRGIWLDRGEPDRLIERTATLFLAAQRPVQSDPHASCRSGHRRPPVPREPFDFD